MGHRRNNRLKFFRFAEKLNSEFWILSFDLSAAYKLDTLTSKTISKLLTAESTTTKEESFGQLVLLGFDIAVFTPAAYQRRRLQRPSMEF